MISPQEFREYVSALTPAEAKQKLAILRECEANNRTGNWSEALGFDSHWMDFPNYEDGLKKRAAVAE